MTDMPLWAELIVSVLLLAGSLLALVGALGVLRLPTFFLRMHGPSLGVTLGTWFVALSSIVYFSAAESRLMIHGILIPLFLAITVPITTILLTRAALFRHRRAGGDVPPAMESKRELAGETDDSADRAAIRGQS
ncbi:MAG: Na+/H+ antiporter subunit [Rhizobacter sp.]|nr:Na+/H+ antiporter subunit [Rhizobacter sp.]